MDAVGSSTYAVAVETNAKRAISVEVGDAKQAEFYPQFKSLHWDNECNFSARLVDAAPTEGTVEQLADGTIAWSRDGRTARFYEKTGEDGGGAFEFEVELVGPPPSNVLEFSIQTKGLDFFYQPPLTELEIKLGAFRPEHVVGSYAVYHSSKRDNVEGQKEYGTGKAFHIYRPWAEDAKGNRVWCDLAIDTDAGVLRITAPQEFIDTAVYPVIVDPTFGYTSAGASTTDFRNFIRASWETISEAGTATQLSAYIANGGETKDAQCAIYAHVSDTQGGALVQASSSTNLSISTGWFNFALAGASLSASTKYFLAAMSAGGTSCDIAYDSVAGRDVFRSASFSTWPNPLNGDGQQGRRYSIYATYTASGGAFTLTADAGAFTLTGVAATLRATRTVPGAAGAFTLTGQTAALKATRTLAGGAGSFALTGKAADLVYVQPGVYSLTAGAGAFALTGKAAALTYTPVTVPVPASTNTIAAAFVEEYQPAKPKKKKKRLQPAPEIIQEFKVLNDRLGQPTRIVYETAKVWSAEDDEEDLLTIMQLLESMNN